MSIFKKCMALLLALCMMTGMSVTTRINANEDVTIKGVYQVSDTQIHIEFSHKMDNMAPYYRAIRIVDNMENQNLQWTGGQVDVGAPLQWAVAWVEPFPFGYPTNWWAATINETLTVNGTPINTFSGIESLVAPGGPFAGCTIAFCIEEDGPETQYRVPESGYMECFWQADNFSNKLKATLTGYNDRVYCKVEKPEDSDLLRLNHAYVYNDTTVIAQFSQPFDNNGRHYVGLRLVDENNTLQWSGGAVDVGTPYQWDVAISSYFGSSGQLLTGTIQGATYSQICAQADEMGFQVKLCFQETSGTSPWSHYVDSVWVLGNTGKLLWANKSGDSDGAYCEVTAGGDYPVTDAQILSATQIQVTFDAPVTLTDALKLDPAMGVNLTDAFGAIQYTNGVWSHWDGVWSPTDDPKVFTFTLNSGNLNAIVATTRDGGENTGWNVTFAGIDLFPQTPLTLDHGYIYDDTTVIAQFSEPFDNNGRHYVGLRLVDENNNLQWSGGAVDVGTPYQWDVAISSYFGNSGQLLIGTILNGTYSQICAQADEMGFQVKLCIQEIGGTSESHYVDSVWSLADNGKFLWANKVGTSDGAYCEVTAGGGYAVAAAEILSATEVKITFEQETTITDVLRLDPQMGVNLTDAFGNIQCVNGVWSHWDGAWTPTGDPKVFTFTLERGDLDDIAASTRYGGSSVGWNMTFAGIDLDPKDLLTLDQAYIYEDKTIIVQFSEPFDNNGSHYIGLRLVDENNNLQWSGGAVDVGDPYQWDVAISSYFGNSGELLIGTILGAAYSEIYAQADTLGFQVKLCIEEKNGTPENHYLESIWARSEAGKYLWANRPAYSDGAYCEVTDATGAYAVAAAEIFSATEVKVTFEQAVTITDALKLDPQMGVNLTNAQGEIKFENDAWSHWDGEWTPTGDPKVFIFTLDGGNLHEIAASTQDTGANAGWHITLAGIDLDPQEPLTLLSAEIVNDTQIMLTFSEGIELLSAPFAGLRLLDADGKLIWDGGAVDVGTPMQWEGRLEYANDAHTQVLFTMTDFMYNVESIADVLSLSGDLAPFKSAGYQIKLCMEEITRGSVTAVRGNHVIDNIKSASRGKYLDATFYPSLDFPEAVQISLTGTLPADKLYLKEARAISDTTILLTFSAPVAIPGSPFLAVRLVDENDTLVWDGEIDKSTPMQWEGTWSYANQERTQIKWTMLGNGCYGIKNLTALLSKEGLPQQFRKYEVKFGIEEKQPCIAENLHIDSITLSSNSKIHLQASYQAAVDRLYVPIKIAYTQEYITARAEVLNDQQVAITFSSPVKISGVPFLSLRYVENNKLLWTGEFDKSTPLQFYGTWEWADTSNTKIIWTMNGANTYGANNIYDAFYQSSSGLSMFSGANLVMGIEEWETEDCPIILDNDLVDNVSSLDGTRHLKASYGSLNGLYMELENTALLDEILTVVSAKAIDDMTIEVTFSAPVVFGEGSLAPSIGVRYLTPTGATEFFSDGRALNFKGTYIWKNDTTLVWTLDPENTFDAANLSDIFTFAGAFAEYKDSTIAFCIQDPTIEGLTTAWNMRVQSVTSKNGTAWLSATRQSEFGVCQTEIEICYDLEIPAGPGEPSKNTENQNPMLWVYIATGALVLTGLVVGIVVGKKRPRKAS